MTGIQGSRGGSLEQGSGWWGGVGIDRSFKRVCTGSLSPNEAGISKQVMVWVASKFHHSSVILGKEFMFSGLQLSLLCIMRLKLSPGGIDLHIKEPAVGVPIVA